MRGCDCQSQLWTSVAPRGTARLATAARARARRLCGGLRTGPQPTGPTDTIARVTARACRKRSARQITIENLAAPSAARSASRAPRAPSPTASTVSLSSCRARDRGHARSASCLRHAQRLYARRPARDVPMTCTAAADLETATIDAELIASDQCRSDTVVFSWPSRPSCSATVRREARSVAQLAGAGVHAASFQSRSTGRVHVSSRTVRHMNDLIGKQIDMACDLRPPNHRPDVFAKPVIAMDVFSSSVERVGALAALLRRHRRRRGRPGGVELERLATSRVGAEGQPRSRSSAARHRCLAEGWGIVNPDLFARFAAIRTDHGPQRRATAGGPTASEPCWPRSTAGRRSSRLPACVTCRSSRVAMTRFAFAVTARRVRERKRHGGNAMRTIGRRGIHRVRCGCRAGAAGRAGGARREEA